MANVTDKILGYMAAAAENAFRDSMGYASRGGAYEPEMPDEAKAYKANRISKIEAVFDKLVK